MTGIFGRLTVVVFFACLYSASSLALPSEEFGDDVEQIVGVDQDDFVPLTRGLYRSERSVDYYQDEDKGRLAKRAGIHCPPGLPPVNVKRSGSVSLTTCLQLFVSNIHSFFQEWVRQLQDLERRLVLCNMINNVSKVRLFKKRSRN